MGVQEHKSLEAKHKEISSKAANLEEELAVATEARDAMSEAHAALRADHEKLQSDADKAVDAATAIEKELDEQKNVAADLKVRYDSVIVSLHPSSSTSVAFSRFLGT
jgi:chromosome segregation ATPase